MASNERIRKYLDAGSVFGQVTRGRAEEIVRELVNAGDIQRETAQEWVDNLVDRSRNTSEQIIEMVRHEVSAQLSRVDSKHIEGLANQVADVLKKSADVGRRATKDATKRAEKTAKAASTRAEKTATAARKQAGATADRARAAAKKAVPSRPGRKTAGKKATGAKKAAAKKSSGVKKAPAKKAPAKKAAKKASAAKKSSAAKKTTKKSTARKSAAKKAR